MNRYGSRKFLIAVAIIIASVWALSEYLIGEDTFRTLLVAVIGLYGAANVAQKKLTSAVTTP